MAEGADPESKTEEATPRKLEDARKKGDAATSPDVAQVLSLAGAAAVILMGGGWFASSIAEQMLPFIAAPPMIVASITAEKLKPKWSAVSPMQGFKRIFGPDGLVQFLKTFLKLVAVCLVCWMVLKPHAREFENLVAVSPLAILPLARDMAISLFVAAIILLGATAGADFIWQKMRFAKRMRMTKEELKEDFKQSEGDPHIKAKLKQIRMQRSRQRMMANVPKATVIVTNPTHYSVALRYEPDQGDGAPICVAKGVDALALRIREVATEHNVPIVENVPLARALYATVDVDEVIPREHFDAAAKIIGFVFQSRARR